MIKDNDVYVCDAPTYSEQRHDKHLLLWSDVPTWIIGDGELLFFLRLFNGKNTVKDVIEYHKNFFLQKSDDSKEKLKQLISMLVNSKILHKIDSKNISRPNSLIRNVIIHPTNRCNLHCIMCCNTHNQVPKEKEINIDSIKSFLNQVRPYCTEQPTLSIIGGEPLLEMRKVLSIVEHARTLNFHQIGISTNGTLVTKYFAQQAKKFDMEVQVSIDGVTKEENDFTRGKGTFKKILDAIQILRDENVCIVTNYTCHIGNYESLERYLDMMHRLGVTYARFGPVKRIGSGMNEKIVTLPIDHLLSHAYDIFKRRPDLRKLFGKDYLSAFTNSCRLKEKYTYCGTGLQTLLLNADGNIYPCTGHALPEFKAGNILKQSFSDIWTKSPILLKIRNTYPVDCLNEKCSSCLVRYWCMGGCRAEAYHCTKTMNSPAIECENIKKAIFEIFWLLSSTPELGGGNTFIFD